MVHRNGNLDQYKETALQAAKDLLYPEKVIKQIEAAQTCNEISRIMTTTRKKYL